MRRFPGLTALPLVALLLSWSLADVHALDLESFEFSDADFTELGDAANTANPSNRWSTDINLLTDSFVQAGSYRVGKFNDDFVSSYLQIANIDAATSGSRFLVARMSGWDIRGFDANNPEEIRFGFIDDDTGTSGSRVTAQVQIARNTSTQAMQIEGNAIGLGSSNLDNAVTVNTVQTSPFTMVLELNKAASTYEVFYKDGNNPSQSLGIGSVAPDRNGNSIRFVVNNNFGTELAEFFSIDRIALTDTNPLTDLLTLEVNRNSGLMKLINTTGTALSGLESYSITSGVGAIDTADWKPITDNYDRAAGPGDGTVDADDDWAIATATASLISEAAQGGNGGNLGIGQEVVLSMGDGPWVRNPIEDLQMSLTFTGGVTRRANVNFVGNGGQRFVVGDLNFDGALTAADWTTFIAGAETDLTGLSAAQAYQRGDLDGDGINSISDFGAFKTAFDAVNGSGAFVAMLASVPEPGTCGLLACGLIGWGVGRRRPVRTCLRHIAAASVAMLALLLAPTCADAAILEEFLFNDANGTLLDGATNSGNPGNQWVLDGDGDMTNSSVQNGSYRVQKDNDLFGTNFLQIDNVTSGTVWWVAEFSGWSFSSLVGSPNFDVGELEEIRFSFLNDDTGTSGSSNTAAVEIQRTAAGGLEVVGNRSGSGGTDIAGSAALNLVQTNPFSLVLELNKDANTYAVFFKDGADPFQQLGTANVDPARNGNSIRFVANNNFSGAGEFVDIDRMYLTDVSPLNVPVDALKLRVNTVTGLVELVNDTTTSFTIDSYRIESTTNDLSFSGWSSLSDRSVDAVDGPDADSTVGNGIGETWDEAGGADNGVLAESFLLGSSEFGVGRTESLGNAFRPGGDGGSLSFKYRSAANGALFDGTIELVSTGPDPDFDGDGDVDGRDFLIWQRGFGSTGQTTNSQGDADGSGSVGGDDLAIWAAQFGNSSSAAVATSVPEPASAGLVLLAFVVMAGRRRDG
jgi:hypothetical protein